jgi:hypothetical protein
MPIDTDLSTRWFLTALLLLAFSAALVAVLWRVMPVLVARYDGKAMQLEPPDGPLPCPSRSPAPGERATWEQLQRWCLEGVGTGKCPVWPPWGLPDVPQRLSVAMLLSSGSSAQRSLVERFSRELDGSLELAHVGGAWAGFLLRLRVKLNDAMWWRARRASDPWDCGYLVNDPAARQALRQFRPRRATLLVAAGDWPVQALRQDIEVLHARQARFHHPVRVLVMALESPAGLEPLAVTSPARMAAWSGLPCEMSLIQ